MVEQILDKWDEARKQEWDRAQRLPLPERYWGSAYSRATKLYDVLEGQHYQRSNDGMIVRIEYISRSHLVLALDVRTREVYRCYEMDFSTKEISYVDEVWEDKKLMWTRISEEDAKAERAKHRNQKIKDGFKALLLFWR